MVWDRFSDIYILNQKERPDRWELCQTELSRVGVENYKQFYSVPADPPMVSFCMSQHAMLKEFVENGEGLVLLALEDDVVFHDLYPLEEALDQLNEITLLYLGCNLRGQIPGPYSENLRTVENVWMSHAIAYHRKVAEFIVDNYDPLKGQMFDDWLGQNVHGLLVAPMVAGQRPGKSDLWGAWTDYTQTIEQGNLLL